MKIAFFDSGIGGITVLKQTRRILPYEDYIYYADTENVPYGIKSRDEISRIIHDAVEFLAQFNLKMLVVACNTATSAAIKELRQTYLFPVIGMEPAVKPAVSAVCDRRILVAATSFTLQGEKLANLVEENNCGDIIDHLPLDDLVVFAEKFEFNSDAVILYLKKKFKALDLSRYGALVLGCTHFIYFKDLIRTLLPDSIEIIDGNLGTASFVKRVLEWKNILAENPGGEVTFYTSGQLERDPARLNVFNKILTDS